MKNNKQLTQQKQYKFTTPVLRFSPTAWAKLLYFRDSGQTEIGGFGISAADDLLFIEDFQTLKQEVTLASVSFEDEAIADFFEDQIDNGKKPEQFGRIWLHSHPGNSPNPSTTDEETFARVFGRCEWAIMFIIAEAGKSFARLRFNTGPGGQIQIPVEVDYSEPFAQSDLESWEAEYKANIKVAQWPTTMVRKIPIECEDGLDGYSCPEEWLEELEEMEPEERRLIMDELANRPDLWDEQEVANVY